MKGYSDIRIRAEEFNKHCNNVKNTNIESPDMKAMHNVNEKQINDLYSFFLTYFDEA